MVISYCTDCILIKVTSSRLLLSSSVLSGNLNKFCSYLCVITKNKKRISGFNLGCLREHEWAMHLWEQCWGERTSPGCCGPLITPQLGMRLCKRPPNLDLESFVVLCLISLSFYGVSIHAGVHPTHFLSTALHDLFLTSKLVSAFKVIDTAPKWHHRNDNDFKQQQTVKNGEGKDAKTEGGVGYTPATGKLGLRVLVPGLEGRYR